MSNVSQEGGGRLMGLALEEREAAMREALGLDAGAPLLADEARERASRIEPSEHLDYFEIEWHVIPSADALPFDDSYVERFYPTAPRDFARSEERRVGKECRSGWSRYREKENKQDTPMLFA